MEGLAGRYKMSLFKNYVIIYNTNQKIVYRQKVSIYKSFEIYLGINWYYINCKNS